jgi:hypothetical protein
VLFSACCNLGVLFSEYADDAGRNLVVDGGLVVFADDIDAEFLGNLFHYVYGDIYKWGVRLYHRS